MNTLSDAAPPKHGDELDHQESHPVVSFGRYRPDEVIANKYRLQRRLGAGGMGELWVALNQALDIEVAIKLIKSDSNGREDYLADRLLQEARAAARLGHPAIVRVFDLGTTDRGDPFIVMELLKGEDLSAALAHHGPVSPIKAVRTLLPIAHALAAAHAKQIVHRDIKPENIFLLQTSDGRLQPKLVDFGLAKLEKRANHRVTQAGQVMGSPSYMSPEQARGETVDARADTWSFCMVLYEMLTGSPAFQAENTNALVWAILSEEPRSILEHGVGDEELWSFIECGLQKEREARWKDIRDLGAALAAWLMAAGVTDDISGASLQGWVQVRAPQIGAFSSVPPIIVAGTAEAQHDIAKLMAPPAAALPTLEPAQKGTAEDLKQASGKLRRWPKRRLLIAAGLSSLIGGLIGVSIVTSGSEPVDASSHFTTAVEEQPPVDPVPTAEPQLDPEPAVPNPAPPATASAASASDPPPAASAEPASSAKPAKAATAPRRSRPWRSPRKSSSKGGLKLDY